MYLARRTQLAICRHDRRHHHHDRRSTDHGHHHHHERIIRITCEPMPMTLNDALMVEVTNWQGTCGLTGGLIPAQQLPCCWLHSVGPGLYWSSFSLGLALTLVTVGVGATSAFLGRQNAGADLTLLKRAPYFESVKPQLVCIWAYSHGHNAITQS